MLENLELEDATGPVVKALFDIDGNRFDYLENLYLKDVVCWFHGGLVQYHKKTFQPKVAILIREIDSESCTLGEFYRVTLNVSDLSAMPVGHVFRLSRAGSAVPHARAVVKEGLFDVDFSSKGWDYIKADSASHSAAFQNSNLKKYSNDYFNSSWFVNFNLENS